MINTRLHVLPNFPRNIVLDVEINGKAMTHMFPQEEIPLEDILVKVNEMIATIEDGKEQGNAE